MLKLGGIEIPSMLVLAPLAGISDPPFRLLNRSFGCELAFTEMINVASVVRRNGQTLRMLSSSPEDRPLGVQLLGGDPAMLRDAVDMIADHGFDIIDFNAACPVKKVVSSGKGAALLKEPERLERLLSTIVLRTRTPVTLKMRSGFDASSINALEIAGRAEDAGVSGIFIHGRTRSQGYGGAVDYGAIRKVKESVSIPVIASGDALTSELIEKLFRETGCDGVVIARGALGNPWIFEAARNGQAGERRPSLPELQQTIKRHLDMNIAFHGERAGVILFRKFFVWYVRGLSVKELKRRAFSACTRQDMTALVDALPVAASAAITQEPAGAGPED